MSNKIDVVDLYVKSTKQKIKDKSKNIEANIVISFWEDPNLYLEYSNIEKDNFINPIWNFFFGLGKSMVKKGIVSFNEVDIELFLEPKQKSKELYDKYGGYKTLSPLFGVCKIDNINTYLDDLNKYSSLYGFIDKATFTESNLAVFDTLNIDETYNYVSALFNDCFTKANSGVITSKLNEGLTDIIEEANKGLTRGLPFCSEALSYEVNGLPLGSLLLFGAISGSGKTTWLIDCVLPSIFDKDVPCVIMLNEQDNVKWKQQFLTYIINNVILKNETKKFSTKRWQQGSFSEEEFSWLRQAQKIIEDKEAAGKIIIVEFTSYSAKTTRRVITKYANLGIKYFFLDTFKLSSDESAQGDAAWLSMQEDMRSFADLVKPANLNVSLVCTLQLQKTSRLNRYLSVQNIGMSKNVVDCASVLILMRRMLPDEYKDGKHELKVTKQIPGTSAVMDMELDPRQNYCIMFIDKNRFGSCQEYQIVSAQNFSFLQYQEIGKTYIMPD